MYGVGFCTYTGESPETESPSSGNSLFTKYEDDVLSVDIKDVPLGEVLQKLSDETGILFSFAPAVGEERVMVRFSNFKIADALNKILSSHDRIFIYEDTPPDTDESLPSKLKEVRIFTPATKSTTKGSASKPSTAINSTSSKPAQPAKNNTVQRKTGKRSSPRTRGKQQTVASLADNLKDSDYSVRLDAVRNLRSVGNADAIGHLTSALEDKNPDVRKEAENALQEIHEDNEIADQDKNTSGTDDKDPPIEGAPTFGVEVVSQSADTVNMDFNLSDVPEPLITAGLMIEYDPTQMSIVSADINEGSWDKGMSNTVKDPKGQPPGTLMFTAGNLSLANPDDSSNIGVASVQFQCLSGNCSGQTVTIGTVPGFDSVVGNSAGVYDSKITKSTYTIP
jgi:hypothetical protein